MFRVCYPACHLTARVMPVPLRPESRALLQLIAFESRCVRGRAWQCRRQWYTAVTRHGRLLCVVMGFYFYFLVSSHLFCSKSAWKYDGVVEGTLVHAPVRPGVHSAVLSNIKFEVADRYSLQKIVGKGSYGAVA